MNNVQMQQKWNMQSYQIPPKPYKPPQVVPPGKHLQQCGGTSFIINEYYETNKIIGCGAFGIVASAMDKRIGKSVAIKKVKNVFRDLVDAKRVLREMKLLMFLRHQNVISLIDIVTSESKDFEDMYLVFELMQTDLEKVIKSNQKLQQNHINFFMRQLLSGIYYLHSSNIIHRDLKPSNLFVNKNCQLKVGDLNLARKFENIDHITEYVVTRWYRAPEILLSQSEYKKAIDVWSIGCIFAELIIRYPLFRGEHFLNQIECIVAILGTPKEGDFPYKVDSKIQGFIKQLPKRDPIPFTEIFPDANPLAIDLLSKMLVYNPNKRYTIEQCLDHEYFKQADIKKINCQEQFDWSFDNIALKEELIRKEMFETTLHFKEKKDLDDKEINEKYNQQLLEKKESEAKSEKTEEVKIEQQIKQQELMQQLQSNPMQAQAIKQNIQQQQQMQQQKLNPQLVNKFQQIPPRKFFIQKKAPSQQSDLTSHLNSTLNQMGGPGQQQQPPPQQKLGLLNNKFNNNNNLNNGITNPQAKIPVKQFPVVERHMSFSDRQEEQPGGLKKLIPRKFDGQQQQSLQEQLQAQFEKKKEESQINNSNIQKSETQKTLDVKKTSSENIPENRSPNPQNQNSSQEYLINESVKLQRNFSFADKQIKEEKTPQFCDEAQRKKECQQNLQKEIEKNDTEKKQDNQSNNNDNNRNDVEKTEQN